MVKAKLIIDGKEINVLWFTFGFNQGADYSGKPSQRPVFVGLKLIIETRKDLILRNGLLLQTKKKQIELHIYPIIMGGKTRKLYFYDCHLVGWKNDFSSTGSNPMSETLEITCAGVEDSTSAGVYSAYWRETFKDDNVESTVLEEPTPSITNINWIHPETKENLKETTYNENVALTAQIENQESDLVTITITKEDGTEFENGQKELTFKESITEDGTIELTSLKIKEQWQEFKTSDIDKLIAKIDHNGYQKKSSALEVVPPPKVIVDFRPNKGYDGEYGFDYMRDKKEKDDKLTYKDILGTNKSTKGVNKFTKYTTDTKYNDLKDNHYNKITFPWYKDSAGKEIEYIQSWLTIYPKESQTLSLQIETIENPKKLELTFEYDKTLFKLNTEKIPAQSKGTKRLKDHLTIECLKEFSTDQIIKVLCKKRLLGQLNILKNDKANRKKAQVVFVKVETNLNGSGKNIKGKTTTSGKSDKDLLEKYLKQALIKLEHKEVIFDLTIPDPTTKKLKHPNFNKDFTLLDITKTPPEKILNKYHNTTKAKLVAFMETEFDTQFPTYKDYYKVFFFGDRGGRTDKVKKIQGLGGYAKKIKSKSVAVFSGRGKTDVTHELLHAMSLYHSFSNTALFGYEKKATKNIMDYSTKKNNTWLWQWKQLWKQADLTKE